MNARAKRSRPLVFSMMIFIFAIFAGATAHAQFFTGPAASGAGGAGRAAVDLGEATFLNPAGVAFLQRYNASAYYAQGQHARDGQFNLWGFSLADGTPGNLFSGGLSYVRKRTDIGAFSDTQQDLQITVAGFPFKRASIGITGHRLTDQVWYSSALGGEHEQSNAHIGLILVPFANLGFGFVAYDVLPTSDSVPASLRLVPTHAIGFNYLYEKTFRARLDFVRPDTSNPGRRVDVMAGAETFFHESFIFRLGGLWRETADRTYFTTGLGYNGPRLSFDYSFQKDVREGDNNRHLIDLWIAL